MSNDDKQGKDICDVKDFDVERLTTSKENSFPLTYYNNRPPKEVDWIVGGMVPANGCVLMHGREKVGKTWLTFDMAISIANGRWVFNDVQAAHGPVLFYSPEGSTESRRRRLWALCLGRGMNPSKALKDIPFIDLNINLMDDHDLDKLRCTVEKVQPVLVILDPLISCYERIGLSENSSDIQAVLKRIRTVTESQHRTSVILVHHETKSKKGEEGTPRGSTAITAWADGIVSLSQQEMEPEEGGSKIVKINTTLRDGIPIRQIKYQIMSYGENCVLKYF